MKFSDLPSYSKETLKRARKLRKNMTPTEWAVWNHIRGKKTGVKFRRQVPIGKYIADFFSLEIGLVIEIDGSQHLIEKKNNYDKQRSDYFTKFDIKTIRFNNYEVSTNLSGILEIIYSVVKELKGLSLKQIPT